MRLLASIYIVTLLLAILEVEAAGIEQTFHDEYDYYLIADHSIQAQQSQKSPNENPPTLNTIPIGETCSELVDLSKNASLFVPYRPHQPFDPLYLKHCSFLI
ncbi:MAG: hypothetical protein ACFHWX_14235 [Bacteroidota bacterium]